MVNYLDCDLKIWANCLHKSVSIKAYKKVNTVLLPVDVCGSKTPVLKLPNFHLALCCSSKDSHSGSPC